MQIKTKVVYNGYFLITVNKKHLSFPSLILHMTSLLVGKVQE